MTETNSAPSTRHPGVVPLAVGDSTVTSLSQIVKRIPRDSLQDHLEDRIILLENSGADLDQAATYYSGLLHGRETFGKLEAN